MTKIIRFTGYRRNLEARGTHTEVQRNADDEPQYEGVVFTDGTCVLKWLTKANSVSVFATLEQMLSVHGHPEYGTEIIWHDGAMPAEWERQLIAHGEKRQHEFHHAGLTDVTLSIERDADGQLVSLLLTTPTGLESIMEQIYPAVAA